jgi:hypothetical protein
MGYGLRIKQLGHRANHSSPSTAKVNISGVTPAHGELFEASGLDTA